MAASNGQRVAAFFLAALFLASTIATTAYVIYQIRGEDGENLLVTETPEERAEGERAEAIRRQQEEATARGVCGTRTYDMVDARPLPEITTAADAITELETIDVKQGEGEEVQPGDCVAALYHGTLASDGSVFDSRYELGEPIEFSLDAVVQGWTDGIPGMKVGGVRRLLIPAAQGYGEQTRDGIPAGSDLIFEVEIIDTRRGV